MCTTPHGAPPLTRAWRAAALAAVFVEQPANFGLYPAASAKKEGGLRKRKNIKSHTSI